MGVVVNGGQGMVVPRLLSAILRRHSESRVRILGNSFFLFVLVVWLLRNDGDDVLKDLVERLMALPPSAEIKVCVWSVERCKTALTFIAGRGACDYGKADVAQCL